MSESPLSAAARVDASQFNQPLVYPDRPPRLHVAAAQNAVEASTVETVMEAKLEALDWEGAQREVNRAIKRGSRDPLAPQATDTQALRAIAELLDRVRKTKANETDEALHAALERGKAIARAIEG